MALRTSVVPGLSLVRLFGHGSPFITFLSTLEVSGDSPPAINAIITFTAEFRNFSFMEMSPEGVPITINAMSRYTLSDTEYTEELIFRVVTNGEEAMYEGPGATGTSPVTMDGDEITWMMPLNEPAISFSGDTFTATLEGEFVDHWERVE